MINNEIQSNYLVENKQVPLSKEEVGSWLSRTGSRFIRDVVEMDGFSKLHIKTNKRLFTKDGEEIINAWVRGRLGPPISDIAHTEIVKQKAQSFLDHFGDIYKKNPNSFIVYQHDIDLIFNYARGQGISTEDFTFLLIDWRLG